MKAKPLKQYRYKYMVKAHGGYVLDCLAKPGKRQLSHSDSSSLSFPPQHQPATSGR